MTIQDCKIDAHVPLSDGSACECGYFQKKTAAPFPFAETYDFLYTYHKDVLHELEEHLATPEVS